MITPPCRSATDSYREQLVRWAGALAAGRTEEICAALAEGDAQDVVRFLVNSFGERCNMLREELAFVALAFDDFDALLEAYVHQVPQTAYDPAYSDRERFVDWLQEARPLTTKERAFIGYQQAEYAVLAMARQHRAEHVAFQRAWRQLETKVARLGHDPVLRIHLNPIRVWSRLALPGRAAGDVLFFAAGDHITAAVLGPVEREFVQVLARGPCSLAECAHELCSLSREELASVCRDRAAEGLLAFE